MSEDRLNSADKALWIKCTKCSHIWAGAYYPMEARALGKILNDGTHCPKCAATVSYIAIAKQDGGVLMEGGHDD